jgi:hypothetical protein
MLGEIATGGEPEPWAREALRLAREDEPQLPRKASIGRVRAAEEDLAELRRVLAATP